VPFGYRNPKQAVVAKQRGVSRLSPEPKALGGTERVELPGSANLVGGFGSIVTIYRSERPKMQAERC
jgi:hypothetical protein